VTGNPVNDADPLGLWPDGHDPSEIITAVGGTGKDSIQGAAPATVAVARFGAGAFSLTAGTLAAGAYALYDLATFQPGHPGLLTGIGQTIADAFLGGPAEDTGGPVQCAYQSRKPAARPVYNTRKAAEEAARRAGNGNDPVVHGPDKGRLPHYHPGNGNKQNPKPLNHDHYYFPRHRY
jgi:hypothetical protein